MNPDSTNSNYSNEPSDGRKDEEFDHLAEHMPVWELDRDVDDWGRSEKLTMALDQFLIGPANKYWFRTKLKQIKSIPNQGPVVVLVNAPAHLTPITLVLAKAIAQQHPARRRARIVTASVIHRQPGLGLAAARSGAVADQQEDLVRLLRDENELLIVPVVTQSAGADRTVSSLTDSPCLAAAVSSLATVVPVSSLGFGRLPVGNKLAEAGMNLATGYLPAQYQFLVGGQLSVNQTDSVAELARSVCESIDQGLEILRSERKSRWLG